MRKIEIKFETVDFGVIQTIELNELYAHITDQELVDNLNLGKYFTSINTGGYLLDISNFGEVGKVLSTEIAYDAPYENFTLLDPEEEEDSLEDLKQQIKDLELQLDRFEITNYYTEEDFYKDEIDDSKTVTISGCVFIYLDILKEMDPVAFKQYYLDECADMDKEDQPAYQELVAELEDLKERYDDLTDR